MRVQGLITGWSISYRVHGLIRKKDYIVAGIGAVGTWWSGLIDSWNGAVRVWQSHLNREGFEVSTFSDKRR